MPVWPTVTIEIAFDSGCIPRFLQSDAAFDIPTGTWTGTPATWTVVTSYALRWGYTRGRQRQLARSEAGTGYIELDNADGRFDPENTASPYGADGLWAQPGKHVRIRAVWAGFTYDLFYGFTTAWEPQGEQSSRPTVRVRVADMIAWFARAKDSFNLAAQLSGNAIRTLLSGDLGLSSAQFDCDDGQLSIAAYGASITASPWSEIQLIADGEEGGLVFVNGAGRVIYHDHLHRYARERSIVLQAIFDNDATAQSDGALPFVEATYSRDETEFYNRVEVTRVGGAVQTSTSGGLTDRFFQRIFSRATRNATNTSALNLSRRLVDGFRSLFEDHGMAQHTSVTIEAGNDVAALWPKALGLTISDQIEVTERLWGGRKRTIPSFIEGMTCDVDVKEVSWKVTYRLSRALSAYHWKIRGKGVAFPLFPLNNDLYYREDLDLLCFYDGSQWLTSNEYEAPFLGAQLQPLSVSGADVGYLPTSTYTKWAYDCRISYYVQTTNNGSNYWTISVLNSVTGATLGSLSSAAVSPGSWNNGAAGFGGSGVAVSAPVQLRVTKVGSPGNIYVSGALRYRLVIP